MSHYNWEWEYGPYDFRYPLNPDLPVYEPTEWRTMEMPMVTFGDGTHSVIKDYETAVELALNVFDLSHMVQLSVVMENNDLDDVSIQTLREADLLTVTAQYLEKNPDKSFNDVLRAIKILIDRLE